jgi:hypothetical protein
MIKADDRLLLAVPGGESQLDIWLQCKDFHGSPLSLQANAFKQAMTAKSVPTHHS